MNGVTNSILKVLDTFEDLGIDAMVVAPGGPGTPSSYRGFPVVQSKALPFMQFPVAIPGLFLSSIFQSFEPDLIHVASPFMLGTQALVLADQFGIPSVAVYQTDLAGYTARYGMRFARSAVDRMVAYIHGLATLNLAPTPDARDYLQSLGVGRVEVWGRGVDVDTYHPRRRSLATTQLLREEFAEKDDLVIGYVGRLAPEKSVNRMSELFTLSPNLKFLIVGDGPERQSLESQFAEHPVHFTGVLRGESLADAYSAIDVFVHFGTEETFGQTIQEAQASGLAVVAPNSGGPRYLIESGVSGILVDPHSSIGYIDAIRELTLNPATRARLSEGGRRAVLQKSWVENNRRLISYYLEAISTLREIRVRDFELV